VVRELALDRGRGRVRTYALSMKGKEGGHIGEGKGEAGNTSQAKSKSCPNISEDERRTPKGKGSDSGKQPPAG